MNKSKKRIDENKRIKRNRRLMIGIIIEIVFALCILMSELCFGAITYLASSIRTYGYYNSETGIYELSSFQQLVDYSIAYNADHENDTIQIAFGDSSTSGELTNFKSIGTQTHPFNGKVYIASAMTLNLPTTMFEAITDNVEILDSISKTPTTLVLTRTRATQDEPLFAKNVYHTAEKSANWTIQYDRYNNPETSSFYTYDIAGIIGTLRESAEVNISVIYNNSTGSKVSNIESNQDAGLICCTMEQSSKLTINSITQTLGRSSNEYNVSSSSAGHAGGLVGSMGDGSILTLGTGLSNPQGVNKNITANNGYAGGIVGYCNGGTIVFGNSSAYTISQIIRLRHWRVILFHALCPPIC